MSFHDAHDPVCTAADDAVALVIEPRSRDLGGFSVRRVLPSALRRMVGPFIFFDEMGPAEMPPGQGINVRPHPHIGIATITYLFDGEIMHRDSLGYAQPIQPGAVNLMTAGTGIVHSERAGDDLHTTSRLHGIQSWIALPDEHTECEPAFTHYPASELPEVAVDGATIRVILGEAFGQRSPVTAYSPTCYAELRLPEGSSLAIPAAAEEQAVYVVTGGCRIDEREVAPNTMAVLCPGRELVMQASADSRVMLIGGSPVGERHIWWNFVARDSARIERAKDDWLAGRFPPVPGDEEFIPLPD